MANTHVHVYKVVSMAEFDYDDKSPKEATEDALTVCKRGRKGSVQWVNADSELVAVYWEDTVVDSDKPHILEPKRVDAKS